MQARGERCSADLASGYVRPSGRPGASKTDYFFVYPFIDLQSFTIILQVSRQRMCICSQRELAICACYGMFHRYRRTRLQSFFF